MKALSILLVLLALSACDESMDNQNRTRTYRASTGLPSWPSPTEALVPPDGTVSQEQYRREQALRDPPQVSRALLARGRARYDIYCAPCHGLTGMGDGFIVSRGFPAPRPLDDPALRTASAKVMLDAISNGKGMMYSFSDRVAPRDRWAIVAYMRALQLAAANEGRAP
jgi:mono/diheme cytochrome c family protein